MKLTVLILSALLVDVPCYSDKPEECPVQPRSDAPGPRIILGPTIIVPDDGQLHPYIHVPEPMGTCYSAGAICQKTA